MVFITQNVVFITTFAVYRNLDIKTWFSSRQTVDVSTEGFLLIFGEQHFFSKDKAWFYHGKRGCYHDIYVFLYLDNKSWFSSRQTVVFTTEVFFQILNVIQTFFYKRLCKTWFYHAMFFFLNICFYLSHPFWLLLEGFFSNSPITRTIYPPPTFFIFFTPNLVTA